MFDLAINTTLDPETLVFPQPPIGNKELPHTLLYKGCAIFLLFREGVSKNFCSLVYSGGLSRDLDVNSVEIKDSSALCHQEIKVVDFSVKIQDWRFLRLTEEQGFSIPKFVDWFEKFYGSRKSKNKKNQRPEGCAWRGAAHRDGRHKPCLLDKFPTCGAF
ncbi:hypothetical protein GQ457_03G016240 [Hibiscus cannabinus]